MPKSSKSCPLCASLSSRWVPEQGPPRDATASSLLFCQAEPYSGVPGGWMVCPPQNRSPAIPHTYGSTEDPYFNTVHKPDSALSSPWVMWNGNKPGLLVPPLTLTLGGPGNIINSSWIKWGQLVRAQQTEHHKSISSIIAIIILFSQSLHHPEWQGKIKCPCCKPFQTEQNGVNTACLQPSAPVVKPQPNPGLWTK